MIGNKSRIALNREGTYVPRWREVREFLRPSRATRGNSAVVKATGPPSSSAVALARPSLRLRRRSGPPLIAYDRVNATAQLFRRQLRRDFFRSIDLF